MVNCKYSLKSEHVTLTDRQTDRPDDYYNPLEHIQGISSEILDYTLFNQQLRTRSVNNNNNNNKM